MRVIVTGLVATYPVGGVAWDYLQYVQAFHALGCDVHYLEDTGQWVYDPAAQTFTDDVSANARYLAAALASLDPGLERRWTVRGPDGGLHGLDERQLAALRPQTGRSRPSCRGRSSPRRRWSAAASSATRTSSSSGSWTCRRAPGRRSRWRSRARRRGSGSRPPAGGCATATPCRRRWPPTATTSSARAASRRSA